GQPVRVARRLLRHAPFAYPCELSKFLLPPGALAIQRRASRQRALSKDVHHHGTDPNRRAGRALYRWAVRAGARRRAARSALHPAAALTYLALRRARQSPVREDLRGPRVLRDAPGNPDHAGPRRADGVAARP